MIIMMKKTMILVALIWLYGCQSNPVVTHYDTQIPVVCNEELVTGMDWVNGYWVAKKGKPREFTLIYDTKLRHPTKKSLANSFSGSPEMADRWICETFEPEALAGMSICKNLSQVVSFNYKILTGSESNSLGNLFPEDKEDGMKDTMYVSAFSCSKTI